MCIVDSLTLSHKPERDPWKSETPISPDRSLFGLVISSFFRSRSFSVIGLYTQSSPSFDHRMPVQLKTFPLPLFTTAHSVVYMYFHKNTHRVKMSIMNRKSSLMVCSCCKIFTSFHSLFPHIHSQSTALEINLCEILAL